MAEAATVALQAAPAILRSLTGVIGLFRQDVSVKNIELTIPDSVLITDVIGGWSTIA